MGSINAQDCEQKAEAGQQVLRPKAGGGTVISPSAAGTVASGPLSGLSVDRHFVQLFVSRDSFAVFLPVKDALVQLGLEYEVIVTEDDHVRLVLGPSQRESFVQ